MNLFEDLKKRLDCEHISSLPLIWRTLPNSFAFMVLKIDFTDYDISQWIDLCNYLQIPFTQADTANINSIRRLFKKHALILTKK